MTRPNPQARRGRGAVRSWVFCGLAAIALTAPGRAARAAEATPYAVVVDYSVDPARFAALKTLVTAVATASIAEPGCRRFDVVQSAAAPFHLMLFEVFADAAAFGAHAATPAFKQFVADTATIMATRTAVPGSLVLSLQKP